MELVGGSGDEEGEKKCIWKGCEKEFIVSEFPPHFSKDDKIDGGNSDRETSPANAEKPWSLDRVSNSFSNFGIQEGRNVGLNSDSYRIVNGSSTRNAYTTQYHHVVSVNLVGARDDGKFKKLAFNLGLVGWNINNKDYNGINLPYFREDLIWHDLQPHRGSHPEKEYNEVVNDELAALERDCLKYCKNAKNTNAELLIEEMNTLCQNLRNKILRWDGLHIHTTQTQEGWLVWLKTRIGAPGRLGHYEKPEPPPERAEGEEAPSKRIKKEETIWDKLDAQKPLRATREYPLP